MNVLVLGGTGFLGPAIVNALVASKHTVTLFNRGRTQPGLFPDLEKLQGDRRTGDLRSLEGRQWDLAIDVFASQPKWVKAACDLLGTRVKTYVFVSTVSVFNDFSKANIGEDGPTFPIDPSLDAEDRVTNESYGPMKIRSEAIVRERFPRTATIVRPGLIVGPGDPTDRFTYWPARIDRGGDVLAPGDGTDAVQFIDVRDLGGFIVRLIDDGHVGTYNATGPAGELSMAEYLHGCKAATSSEVRFTWADAQWLIEQRVAPFMEMPMWVPGPEMTGFARIDNAKARSVGLAFRPLAETARDLMQWVKTRPADHRWQAGLDAQREANLLAKWKARATTKPAT